MVYTLNNYDGTVLTTVADGSLNTTSSNLKFPGKGYTNYGEAILENLVWITSNFAGANSPDASGANPQTGLTGQLWWDTTNQVLRVYNGANWVFSGGAVVSTTAPVSAPASGNFWWDSDDEQLYAWNGTGWRLVGPIGSAKNNTDPGAGTSLVATRIYDGANYHQVLAITVGGTLMAYWSEDASFVPSPAISGFAAIAPGLNLSTAVTNNKFRGTATSAEFADLAERYAADRPYEFGTLVKLGGNAEITATISQADEDVFGVISENPAFEMNSGAGSDETHPFVALTGRVKCKVVGKVKKGQRLMSSNWAGVAQVWDGKNSLAVVGRALANKNKDEADLLEITVGVR